MADLHEAGRLEVGEWIECENLLGLAFRARLVERDGDLIPHLSGPAHITGEHRFRIDLARPAASRVSAPLMAGRLKVGVVLPTYRALASAENIARAAAIPESLGFDSVWVTDHIVVPSSSLELSGRPS